LRTITGFVILLAFTLCAGLVQTTSPAWAAELTVNKIAAVVNGEMITLHALRTHTAAELARQKIAQDDPRVPAVMNSMLDAMINDILIRQEAARYQITITDQEVDGEIRRIVQNTRTTQAAFEEQLVKQGNSMALLRENIRNGMLRQRMTTLMISRKVVVTNEEVAEYYEQHKDAFSGEPSVDFSVIVFKPDVKAENIYKQLASGALSFEDAAHRYSRDASASGGGRIGVVPGGQLPPSVRSLFKGMPKGGLSRLVKVDGNAAVFRLNDILEGNAQTLEEAAPRITEVLREPRMRQRFEEYTSQLRGKAVIDIRL
jgi:peptidyl-prolyl cis-trans isomerase SurA